MPFPVPGRIAELLRRSTVQVRTRPGRQAEGCGSGIVLNDNRILTNAHVVSAGDSTVETWEGNIEQAHATKIDRQRDLALLSTKRMNAPPVTLASTEPAVGQPVIAVGNPLGFVGAVSTGFIYRVGAVGPLGGTRWIQADVRLAPGNSGGPLADIHGQILGMNTMIAGGLALAIPASSLQTFLTDGSHHRTLGVTLRPVMFRPSTGPARPALMILELAPAGPADRASLLPGDLLVSAGGQPLHSPDDLYAALSRADTVQLGFVRGPTHSERRVAVQLDSFPVVSAA